MQNVRYLEPRTDVPAKDDWSTGLIFEDLGFGTRWLSIIAVVSVAGMVGAFFLPMHAGNVAAIVVLAPLGLIGGIGPVMRRVETLPYRRGLLDEPWRRCPVQVVRNTEDKYADYLRLSDGTVLEGFMGKNMPEMAKQRGEIFLCGPNANGKAVVRVAGLAETANAKVSKAEHVVDVEWERPEYGQRPLDDPAVRKAFRGLRMGVRAWLGAAIPAVIGVGVVLLSIWPIAPAGLVVGGLIAALSLLTLPSVIELGRWFRDAVTAVENSAQWNAVPVTLFPWKPGQVVAGLATMPGGRLALVQFVDPNLHVIANVADTGTMWIAGSHKEVIAVGVPRVPVLTLAVLQPDSDTPRELPVPWIQRFTTPDFTRVPTS